MSLQKNILVIGSSSAFGKACSQRLRDAGDYTVGIGRTEQSRGYDEHFLISDYNFGNFPNIDKPIHGLMYCPGTIQLKPFHRITEQEWMTELRVNLLGAVAAVQHYLPQMKAAGMASVIFVSTVAVKSGMSFHSSVAAAKAGLEGLSTHII